MLRGLQSAYLGPLLQAFQVNVTGASAASGVLNSLDLSAVSASSSVASATTKLISRRTRMAMATPVSTTYAFPIYSADPTTSVIQARSTVNAGTATTGKMNILTLGSDHPSLLRFKPYQSVKAMNGQPRIVAGYITSAGAVSIGARDFTVSVASSVYTITLKRAFGRTPIIVAGSWNGTAHKTCTIHTENVRQFKIATWGNGVAEDNPIYFIAMGYDTPTTNYGMRRTIRNAAIRPRLEMFRVTQTAGTYSMAQGNGTLTKNGTGDVKVTFPTAFKRAPICVAIGKAGRACLKAATTTTDATVRLYTAASHNTSGDNDFQLIAFGWDSTVEL